MVSERKKQYMKKYNQRSYVKEKKAEYMRRKRAEEDQKAARRLVGFLLDMGYEDMAYKYALERAPEMLVTAKRRVKQARASKSSGAGSSS